MHGSLPPKSASGSIDCSVNNRDECVMSQTMAASKRANAMPSAFVARQSLNDEELVSMNPLISMVRVYYVYGPSE